MMGLLLTPVHAPSRLATPQCSSIPLRSISLTGFALCEWPYAAPLTCQHDVALHMSLHALLIAYLDYTTNPKLIKDLAKCFGMYSHWTRKYLVKCSNDTISLQYVNSLGIEIEVCFFSNLINPPVYRIVIRDLYLDISHHHLIILILVLLVVNDD